MFSSSFIGDKYKSITVRVVCVCGVRLFSKFNEINFMELEVIQP